MGLNRVASKSSLAAHCPTLAIILAEVALRYRRAANAAACSARLESELSDQHSLGPAAASVPTGSGGYGPREPDKGR